MTSSIDIGLVRKLWRYEPETGFLFWTNAPQVYAPVRNKRAFTSINVHGYYQTNYRRQVMLAHRVAWALAYGRWPAKIDHINGTRTDNHVHNLREVDHQTNLRNCKKSKANTSGITGVCWDKYRKKWLVTIGAGNSKSKHVGRFDDFDQALQARQTAEKTFDYHQNHGRAV